MKSKIIVSEEKLKHKRALAFARRQVIRNEYSKQRATARVPLELKEPVVQDETLSEHSGLDEKNCAIVDSTCQQ